MRGTYFTAEGALVRFFEDSYGALVTDASVTTRHEHGVGVVVETHRALVVGIRIS